MKRQIEWEKWSIFDDLLVFFLSSPHFPLYCDDGLRSHGLPTLLRSYDVALVHFPFHHVCTPKSHVFASQRDNRPLSLMLLCARTSYLRFMFSLVGRIKPQLTSGDRRSGLGRSSPFTNRISRPSYCLDPVLLYNTRYFLLRDSVFGSFG